MIRTFNNKQGNRDRSCRYCIVHQGKAYTHQEAEEKKLAVFKEIAYQKMGKWSNFTWQVTTNSAKLVVIMSPFNGWTDDLEECITHILEVYDNEKEGVSREEALVAFQFLYPSIFKKIQERAVATTQLI